MRFSGLRLVDRGDLAERQHDLGVGVDVAPRMGAEDKVNPVAGDRQGLRDQIVVVDDRIGTQFGDPLARFRARRRR